MAHISMKCTIDEFVSLVWNDSRIKEYDDMFDLTNFISNVDKDTTIKRLAFKVSIILKAILLLL